MHLASPWRAGPPGQTPVGRLRQLALELRDALEELVALRREKSLLKQHNEKLQLIVDGMLRPYGNLRPWVEWWSAS